MPGKKIAVEKPEDELNRLRQLAEAAFEAVVLHDNGIILEVNPAAAVIFGYDRRELIGKSLSDLAAPESRALIKGKIRTTVTETYEALGLRKGGSRFYCVIHTRVTVYNGRPVQVAAFSELFDQKKAETALKDSEEKLRSFVEHANDIIFTLSKKKEITFISPNWIEKLGREPSEVVGKTYEFLVHPDDLPRVDALFEQIVKTGKRGKIEYRIKHKDGTWRWLAVNVSVIKDAEVKIFQVFGIAKDVTEQKRAEEALRESEERYRNLVDSSPIPIFVHSQEKIVFLNSAAIKTLGGNSMEDFTGKSVWDIISPDYRLISEKRIKQLYEKQKNVELIEKKFIRLDGEVIDVEVMGTISDYNGKPSAQVVFRDITQRKRAEEERRKLEEQLHQAQKIEAIGNLSGGIAHDFNNLLTVINGHAEFALMKIQKDHLVYKDLKSILDAGKRAENLVRQLLAFSRKQIYESRVIDVNQVITGLDKMVRRLIGEDIDMQMLPGQDIPPIKADPIQIEQILVNLIVNSRDAIKERMQNNPGNKKRIAIETDRVYLDESYASLHPETRPGLYVSLVVSDTGTGMDAKTKSKIFEPFFTTKEKDRGTGLGLATVYGIVKQNNGSIYVYSEPSRGTTIKIYWPSTKEIKASEAAQRAKMGVLTGKETILLVEDDDPVRHFATETLKELGYVVMEAPNGRIALDVIKKNNLQVDLLLTDLVMPEMDGKELAEKVKMMFPAAAILYTSGYTDLFMQSGALKEGIHFIQKPYSFQGVAEKVRTVLDKNNNKRSTAQ